MRPFKRSSFHKLFSGGTFPPPPTASHLMTMLPPPDCFQGPFVGVDSLISLFNKIILPENR